MANQQIPSFDLKRNYARVASEVKEAVERVLASQHFIMGPDIPAFEAEIVAYLETPYAVTCASGTDSLLLALMALGIGAGDEVITTPFSFFATASCITRLGARPVFADVHPDTYNVSMEQVLNAVTPRTKAFIPVHLFGQMCRLEEGMDELRAANVAVVEDCAQAIGAHRLLDGTLRRAGTWGDIGCFSFFPTKNLGAYGDAGMASCRDEAHKNALAKLRVHGATSTYIHEEIGINSRMDSIQAAVLRVRLKHLETWTEERREIARRYELLFAENGLSEFVVPPVEDAHNRHTYHQYVIKAARRDELHKYLADEGIVTRIYYPLALHMQPCFASAGYKEGDMPVSEQLCREVLALPMFPELTADEQEQIVGAMSAFYRK